MSWTESIWVIYKVSNKYRCSSVKVKTSDELICIIFNRWTEWAAEHSVLCDDKPFSRHKTGAEWHCVSIRFSLDSQQVKNVILSVILLHLYGLQLLSKLVSTLFIATWSGLTLWLMCPRSHPSTAAASKSVMSPALTTERTLSCEYTCAHFETTHTLTSRQSVFCTAALLSNTVSHGVPLDLWKISYFTTQFVGWLIVAFWRCGLCLNS